MALSVTLPPERRSCRHRMSLDTDTDLLKRIAASHDEAAFRTLYDRYSGSAYSVARHIAQDRSLAEDAVQEAMVSVWRTASRFDQGNARSWILRIVANKTLNLLRKQRTRKAQMDEARNQAAATRAPAAEEVHERRELLAVLHEQLHRMSHQDQRLLALYYGGGLSQEEIAKTSDVSQMTISMRLAQALDRLRGQLRQVGYATPALVALPNALPEAFQAGYAAPAALQARIFAKIAEGSLRMAAARAPFLQGIPAAAWIALLVLPLLCLAGYEQWVSEPAPSQAETVAAAQASTAPGAPQSARVLAQYDFTAGVPDGCQAQVGTWHWSTDGLRAPSAMPGGYLNLPVKTPSEPFEVTAEARVFTDHSIELSAGWRSETGYLPRQGKDTCRTIDLENGGTVAYRAVFNGAYRIEYMNGTVVRVGRYPKPYPSDRLFLNGVGVSFRKVTVRSRIELSEAETKPEQISPEHEFLKDNNYILAWNAVPSEPMILAGDGLLSSIGGRRSLDPFQFQPGQGSVDEPLQTAWTIKQGKTIARESSAPSEKSTKDAAPTLALKTDGERFRLYEITNVRKRPFVLETTLKKTVEGKSSVACRWGTGEHSTPFLIWPFNATKAFGQMTKGTETTWVRFYFVDNFIVMIRENQEQAYIMEHRLPYEGGQVYMRTENLWLTRLEYRELEPDGMPAPLRTIRAHVDVPGEKPMYNPSVLDGDGPKGLKVLQLD